MKKITLSIAALMAMGSTMLMAGGDITPIEEPVVVVEEVMAPSDSGFYLGLGYTWLNTNISDTVSGSNLTLSQDLLDDDFSDIMFQAGYKLNDYVSFEGRYWVGLDSTSDWYHGDVVAPGIDTGIDAWGIYVKPMYPVTDAFDIYALLGYASAELTASGSVGSVNWDYTSDNVDGFSWGLGASYSFTDSVSVFADYVSIYDDDLSIYDPVYDVDYDRESTISTWNFGVNYKF